MQRRLPAEFVEINPRASKRNSPISPISPNNQSDCRATQRDRCGAMLRRIASEIYEGISRASKRNSPISQSGCRATQKDRCGDFAEDCFRIYAEIQSNPLQYCADPGQQPRDQAGKDQRGSGGNAPFAFPRRLCARGSMTLRRAKAASQLQAMTCMLYRFSLCAAGVDDPSTRESGPRLQFTICLMKCVLTN